MITKRIAFILFFLSTFFALSASAQTQVILQDSIVGNVHLTADQTYLLRGFVYVVNGVTLTIDAGTIVYGEKSSKGTLIVERGGKIIAIGTPQRPIIFTSQQPVGQRASGDWGGIVLCGNAPINQNNTNSGGAFPGGDAQIEGGPRSHYGGQLPADNSGILEYIRIEYPGIALSPNNEINGLTMGGVGSGTTLDHIQVSYSGDDSYEWFGGNVNVKNIIAFKGLDDDFDTDFGFGGRVQFGVALRDPNIADVSLSNGFESDNDATGDFWSPRTSVIFCNMTSCGPQSDTSKSFNALFGRGAHIRRSSQLNIVNSIVMGWPTGLLLDGAGVVNGAKNDTVQIRNCIWAGLRTGFDFLTNVSGFGASSWYATPSFNNQAFIQPSSVGLADPFNQTAPNWRPLANSPAINHADFTNPKFSNESFFTKVSYVGAFDPAGPRWDSLWSNYDPQNTNYVGVLGAAVTDVNFPNTFVSKTKDSVVVLIKNTGNGPLQVVSVGILDSTNFKIVSGNTVPFTLIKGDTKAITIRFAPTVATVDLTTKIKFTAADNSSVQVNLKGTGVASAPVLSVESTHDFALVRLNESNTQTIVITNTGAAPLTLSNFAITGANASDFTFVSGNTNTSVDPSKTQSVVIKFMPTTIGSKTATLQFSHNAPSGQQTVTLTGKGIEVYGQDIAKDSIVGDVHWTNDRTWLIRGFLYVVNGATLTIDSGTTIYGEKATKGCLIVERGGKLIAKGTKTSPILFLSQQKPGERQSGDWGGIILCGRSPINQNNSANGGNIAGGDAQIEGGPRSHYGGTDPHDNSGDLEYIRIEFPGIPLSPNNEINGLTMGGVGDGTIIDHIQVSYSGDDSYEWFGGTVNVKHIIAFKGLDDDFDTDFGFSGKVQFGVALRDPNIADISLSNGFESDNDATSDYWNPRTSVIFCNMTSVGP
ncbi:MAG TPA: choice-of-anchor D domain-containing protein, partial [Candidatus Kapabacteria bacterium]|nr:choice-of-anchor D domain-containing protein [Candidatus Kapabacteria bacterium]